MTNIDDWSELLFSTNNSDTIILAAGHLVYQEMFEKECPQSELPNQFVLSEWLTSVLAREAYICPVLIRTLEAKTATWCIRWNGDVKEIAGRTTTRAKPMDLAGVHALWRKKWQSWEDQNIKDPDDEGQPGHPVMALLRKWYDRSRGLDESQLYVSNERFVQSYNPVNFVGQGVFRRKKEVSMPLKDALLPVARVDGEIMATQDPFSDTPSLLESFYAPIPGARKAPFRKTLFDDPDCDQVHTSNVILATLSNYSLTTPKNNTHLRTDIYKIAAFTFLFPHRVNIPFSDARRIVVGEKSNTQRNRRVNQAIDVLRGIQFVITHKNIPITVPLITYDADVTSREPVYILGRGESFRKAVAPGYMAVSPQWSLSGVFTRNLRFKSGGIERLINGLELVLANSRFTRKGPKRKFSEFLIPADRKTTGPGKAMYLTWKEMMYLAGEFIGESEDELRRSYQNWNNWMRCLQRNGYYCKDGREAEAYDTIEIVSRISGNRHHMAGAWIRASSRFTEAVRLQQSDQMETMSATDFLSTTLRP